MANANHSKRSDDLPPAVYRIAGEVQSEVFCDGVAAVRDFIRNAGTQPDNVNDETVVSRFGPPLAALLAQSDAEFAAGAAAAFADLVATMRHSDPDLNQWAPLEPPLLHRLVRGVDVFDPPPGSAFFEVRGIPVSVGEDHSAYRWDGYGPRAVPLAKVMSLGRRISRPEFDSMLANVRQETLSRA